MTDPHPPYASPEEELADLQRQIRETVKTRLAVEKSITEPAALEAAIARAQRDRDAVLSPEIREERAKTARVIDKLLTTLATADRIAWGVARAGSALRHAPAAIHDRRTHLVDTALPALQSARGAIERDLSAAGLGWLFGYSEDE